MLWAPSEEAIARTALARFGRSVGLGSDYQALWQWSVDDVEGFWRAVWTSFDVRASRPPSAVLTTHEMPGATWFPGARLSYAEHFFRDRDDDVVAIRHATELRGLACWTWGDLRDRTARVARGLRRLGVGPGDRVAAYLPNVPETIAAFLATASLGAIWTCAAPEFGAQAVLDRFSLVRPKVLLGVDGYRYGGRDFERASEVQRIGTALGATVVTLGHLDGSGWPAAFVSEGGPLAFEQMAFGDPLWVLYSSGTTGPPKAIVHSQGGMLLEQLKSHHLHLDARPEDRIFWYTTTGWMMWNYLVGALLTPASIVLYDGSPTSPDVGVLWDLAERSGTTVFGTSAAYLGACLKAGFEPRDGRDLAALRAVGSTGSPLSEDGFRWVYEALGSSIWLFSMSGGTDVCTAFLGGVPTLPVCAGELQGPALGAKVEAFDPSGAPVVGEVGELVVTEPLPSMPIALWGDDDGTLLSETYFSTYPGVWRHGDWVTITDRNTAVIHGRSDSTINRGGVRIGTGELYRAVLAFDDVVDAVVVDVPRAGGNGWMHLFVVLDGARHLDAELADDLRKSIRRTCSPRHVPDQIQQVPAVPRTLSGKLIEVPIKRILSGAPPESVVSRASLENPEALDTFIAMAAATPAGPA